MNAYATYATGFKSIGLNLSGVPTDALGRPVLSTATVKPEDVRHIEVGREDGAVPGRDRQLHRLRHGRSRTTRRNVVNAQVGVLRGYLANAEKVRVRGVEFDGSARVNRAALVLRRRCLHRRQVRLVPRRAAAARGDGRTAGQGHLRIGAAGHFEVGALARRRVHQARARSFGRPGEFFGAVDASYRSQFSSSARASRYLVVDGYCAGQRARRLPLGRRLVAVRSGRATCSNKDYFELLSPAPGNSGLYRRPARRPATVGVTLRMALRLEVERSSVFSLRSIVLAVRNCSSALGREAVAQLQDCRPKTEDRRPRPKTEDRRPKTVNCGLLRHGTVDGQGGGGTTGRGLLHVQALGAYRPRPHHANRRRPPPRVRSGDRAAAGAQRPESADAPPATDDEPLVGLSARNRLRGFVEEVRVDGLLAQVKLRVGTQSLTAVITADAVRVLKLRRGDDALAVIKSTEVMIARTSRE